MELEHAFQQSEFLTAIHLMVMGTLIAPGMLGGRILYYRLVRVVASSVVSFGPMALLVYILYKVSHLC